MSSIQPTSSSSPLTQAQPVSPLTQAQLNALPPETQARISQIANEALTTGSGTTSVPPKKDFLAKLSDFITQVKAKVIRVAKQIFSSNTAGGPMLTDLSDPSKLVKPLGLKEALKEDGAEKTLLWLEKRSLMLIKAFDQNGKIREDFIDNERNEAIKKQNTRFAEVMRGLPEGDFDGFAKAEIAHLKNLQKIEDDIFLKRICAKEIDRSISSPLMKECQDAIETIKATEKKRNRQAAKAQERADAIKKLLEDATKRGSGSIAVRSDR
jgi:hypothetical protein